jgi:WD40 repeat protein
MHVSLTDHYRMLKLAIGCIVGIFTIAGLISQAIAQNAAVGEPLLRIETGTHTATSDDASVDAGGTVLVSASRDKTARIWSLPDLRPIGVLRPPIGSGEQGRVHAVAVSPDAHLAAIAGWIPSETADGQDVLVFDLQTRRIVLRLTSGLPNIIVALAFSPDGKRLAAGIGSAHGIRIWSVSTGTMLTDDRDYGDSTYGLAFAPDGRLAAASLDGAIRLYDPQGRRLLRTETGAGKQPFKVRFDPRGQMLATIFANVLAVELRDGTSLTLQSQADVSGLTGKSFSTVGWSATGATLYAGGFPTDRGRAPVFAWSDADRKIRHISAAGFATIPSAVLLTPDDRLVLLSRAGDIAVIGPGGKPLAERRTSAGNLGTALNDYASPTRRLSLSRDGTQVEWVPYGAPNQVLRFDAHRLEFATGTPPSSSDRGWTDREGELQVDNWDNHPDPKLNDKLLALEPPDQAQSVAVADGRILIGASWFLHVFDRTGQQLWATSIPAAAWRVNQSADGRLAVAALGDGTIRWYRLRDGHELLALFVSSDTHRWIAYTPSGYYDASAGGEGLIGWQVNNKPGQTADFFPASKFRRRFYRPAIVSQVLTTLDETEAVRAADTKHDAPTPTELQREVLLDRPPVVTIVAPRDGAQLNGEAAALDAEVRSPTGQAITRIEVRLNARPVQAEVGGSQPINSIAGERLERRHISVPIPPGQDANLQLIAWIDDRSSEPATLRLRGRPLSTGASQTAVINKPRLNALLVGISAYKNVGLKLKFAAKDAYDLGEALKRQAGPDGLYREVNVHVLPEAKATREAILREIVWLQRGVTQRDLAVLFLAGHGLSEDGEYYFLPVDGDVDNVSILGLSGTDLRRRLGQIPSRTIALLDTCYAGAMASTGSGFRGPPPDLDKLVNELSSADAGVAVYSATTGNRRALELDELQHGVFTRALLDVLSGRAQHGQAGTGELRLNMLANLLAEDVRSLTAGKQATTYTALAPLADLPLFLVR